MQLNREKLDYAANYLSYAAGRTSTVPLRLTHVIHSLLLVVGYTWNVVGGNGAGAVAGQSSHRVLDEYIMRGNGDKQQVWSGPALYFYNLLFTKQLLPQIPPTAVAAGTVEAGRQSIIALPFVMGHTTSPDEWGLPPLRDPSVTFRWAPGAELVTAAQNGAQSLTNVTLDLYERWYENMVPPPTGFSAFKTAQWEKQVLATGKVQIELEGLMSGPENGPGHEVRALLIEALIDGVNDAQYAHDNSLITNLKLELSGEEVQKEIDFSVLQAENVTEYQLAARETGLVVLDAAAHDQNTRRGQLWTITGRAKPMLTMDCVLQGAGQNKVRVTAIYTAGRYAARG